MKRNLPYTLLLLLICLATACVKDDTTPCNKMVELKVDVDTETTSPDGTFNAIGIYVFDAAGVFVGFQWSQVEEQGNGQVITLSLPQGKYSLITWCGTDFDTDYQVVAQTPQGLTTSFEKGVTQLADMRLRNKNDGVAGHQVGNLYWGEAHEVNINNETARVPVSTQLVKNTNQIEIVLADMAEATPLPSRSIANTHNRANERYSVELTTQAGVYNFDNSLNKSAATPYTYQPYEVTEEDGALKLKLKTMRLFVDQPVELKVKDHPLNRVVYTTDLMELIRQNPAYRTQDALDKESTFTLVITRQTIGTVVDITITVNGWEIINLNPHR